jgi:hypothetical protein
MPTGRNWINFLYINIGFIVQILVLMLLLKKKEIKEEKKSILKLPVPSLLLPIRYSIAELKDSLGKREWYTST